MAGGPLIPGMREFDRPRSGWPAWLTWVIASAVAIVVLVVLAGFAGGVGPLRALGQSTTPLVAVSYRATSDPAVIQVAVRLPESGLCRDDDISVISFERSNRIEVDAAVTRSRTGTCPVTSIGGDLRWVDVPLGVPLGTRTVIRTSDREPVPMEAPER